MDLKPPAPYQQYSITSLEAALSMKSHLGRMEGQVLSYIAARGDYGATDAEIIEALGSHSYRPRRIALVQRNILKDSGLTRKTPSGRKAVVWVVADGGKPHGE